METSQANEGIRVVEPRQWPCPLVDTCYEVFYQEQLGRGTYGSVYRARNLNDDKLYALKKMEHIQDKNQLGFPITTIRQIKILQGLSHENILNIKQVVYKRGTNHRPPAIFISLNLMECDLLEIIKNKHYKMTSYRIQQMLKQILTGLVYLHSHNIAHRDIKPSNILISENQILKIADFGLAKKLKKLSTTRVVTMWYRAPELLLGVKSYTAKVDVWSVGCIAAELLLRNPLFDMTNNQTEILNKIYEFTGTPDRYGWEEELLAQGKNYSQCKPSFSGQSSIISYLREKAPQYENQYELLDLIQKMLRLNHHSRFSASECLNHDFFRLNLKSESLMPWDFMEDRRTEKEGELGRKRNKLN